MITTAREIKLLKKCLKGNSQAFEGIVAKYQELVCAITFSGTADFQQSEELAHQTFINAWKNLSQLKDLSKFRPWLCTIARNNIRNFINKSKRDIIAKAKPMENINDTTADESGPLESAIKKEHEALVREAIQQIPEQYREPLVLYYRRQQSVKQVALSLDLSEEAVKQRLSRGRNMLKEQVAAIVETTISRTGPGIVFTAAVVAALPAIVPQVASAAIAATAAKGSLMAKSAPLISTMGWILGPLLGLIGAIVAIRADLKNISRRQRRFLIWTISIQTAYLLVLTLIAVPLCLWWNLHLSRSPWLILAIYFALIFLPGIPFTIWASRREKQIQIEDGTYVKPEWRTLTMTKGQIYGAFGGSIFGSLVWLFRVTTAADDWGMFGIVLAAGILIFLIAAKLCARDPRYGFKIASVVFICVGFLNLLMVNLRWDKWAPAVKDPRFTLVHINWTIVAVVAVLILVALIADWRHQKMRNINSSSKISD